MRKKFWQIQKFKELQKEWENKLRESGFVDVEDDRGKLRQNASNSYRTTNHTLINAKLRYYELLGHWNHEKDFRDHVERLVMERRANGVMIKDICKELEGMGERCHRETVRWIIQFYEKRWKIKKR